MIAVSPSMIVVGILLVINASYADGALRVIDLVVAAWVLWNSIWRMPPPPPLWDRGIDLSTGKRFSEN